VLSPSPNAWRSRMAIGRREVDDERPMTRWLPVSRSHNAPSTWKLPTGSLHSLSDAQMSSSGVSVLNSLAGSSPGRRIGAWSPWLIVSR
jgi:hypothetical protein